MKNCSYGMSDGVCFTVFGSVIRLLSCTRGGYLVYVEQMPTVDCCF
jgi:hypothetical protein